MCDVKHKKSAHVAVEYGPGRKGRGSNGRRTEVGRLSIQQELQLLCSPGGTYLIGENSLSLHANPRVGGRNWMSAGKRADGIFFDDFDRMDYSRWSL